MPRASAGLDMTQLRPMLLTERKAIPRGDGWLAEIKFDGYRALALTGSAPYVQTKNGADCTTWFPELLQGLANLPAGCILDGEICVLDDLGRADFERVHARARRRRWHDGADPVVYCVFDLIALQGRDIRQLPIEDRKGALERMLTWSGKGKAPGLLYVQALLDQAAWLYSQILTLELEGIVCKRTGSTYQDGIRSTDWIKVKRPGAVPAQRFSRQSPRINIFVDVVRIFVYSTYINNAHGRVMKQSEFKRWLAAQGCTFKEGSKHTKVYRGDKQSTLPRHPSLELKTGLVNAIKKQLGLD